jgi:hypothetical protein
MPPPPPKHKPLTQMRRLLRFSLLLLLPFGVWGELDSLPGVFRLTSVSSAPWCVG